MKIICRLNREKASKYFIITLSFTAFINNPRGRPRDDDVVCLSFRGAYSMNALSYSRSCVISRSLLRLRGGSGNGRQRLFSSASSSRSEGTKRVRRNASGAPNAVVTLGACALASCAFFYPLYRSRTQGENLTAADRPLSGSTTMRGNYLNTGSKDMGPDPDWDLKTGTYLGYKKGPRKAKEPQQRTKD